MAAATSINVRVAPDSGKGALIRLATTLISADDLRAKAPRASAYCSFTNLKAARLRRFSRASAGLVIHDSRRLPDKIQ